MREAMVQVLTVFQELSVEVHVDDIKIHVCWKGMAEKDA